MKAAMDRADRAKQFMPFAALKGLDELLDEAGRLIIEQICLGEDAALELDARLQTLRTGTRVVAVYYADGAYQERSGLLRKIDLTERCLYLEGLRITFDSLLTIREVPT